MSLDEVKRALAIGFTAGVCFCVIIYSAVWAWHA